MGWKRTYTDEQLVNAIAQSTSWRGVLRELGLAATSGGAVKSVRVHANRLGIDFGHFTGQRRWTDASLAAAVTAADSWTDVAVRLNLHDVSAADVMKGHAARLGLNVAHLAEPKPDAKGRELQPSIDRLNRAGSLMAAAWFTLCGCEISWPLEPSRYDLLAAFDGMIRRVQVKTTTVRVGDSWKVYLSTSRRNRRTYDPDEVDDFFIIDGDLQYYLIPLAVVGGLHAIHLGGYGEYRVSPNPLIHKNYD
ncbi:hypothetical protein AAFP35_10745 [Gordonia sp. CPCC 206044]|uniref:group I intron-associated PD-(D/E)XK endonuclease n=1 Tax=Gordonia sp. CPCC 206044 TaxID=3140793 RepID=UPI003AF33BE1